MTSDTASSLDRSATGGADFICFSGQDWWYHNRAHSDFQLMLEAARDRRVLVVNSIGMRMPMPGRSAMFVRRILRKVRSTLKFLRRPVAGVPNLHVLSPIVVPFYSTPWIRSIHYAALRLQVSFAARWIGIRNPVVFLTLPTAWEVARKLQNRAVIYNRADKHSRFGEANSTYIETLEREVLRRAQLVVYPSSALMQEEAELVGGRGVFLDHGVDIDLFQRNDPEDEPADLARIPRPRIGFFGGFDDYVIDFDLLERVAKEIPEAHLVLIGRTTHPMTRITRHPNVHWLDFRPHSQIPRYGSGFDVAIMPWLKNEWIRYCNPIKMKEYLALGLGVVSTAFPAVEMYRDVVRIAENDDRFIELIREQLEQGPLTSPERMRDRVRNDSWHRQASILMALADECAES